MVDKNDIETAKTLATIIEWRKNVDEIIDEHTARLDGVEKWQIAITNARKLLIPYMTLGAVVAFVLSFIVFSARDPVTALQILKSLIGLSH